MRRSPFVVLAVVLSTQPAAAAPTDPIPFAWEEVLRPARAQALAEQYLALMRKNPKSFELREKAAPLLFVAWLFEKKAIRKRHLYARAIIHTGSELLKLNPEHAAGHLWTGVGLSLLGLSRGVLNSLQLVPEGRKALEKSAAIDPTYMHATALFTLGRAMMMLPGIPVSVGSPEEALKLIAEGIRLAPHFALGPLYMADFYWMLGKDDAALQELQQLRKIKPSDEHAAIMLEICRVKAAELERRIKAGEVRARYEDWMLMDLKPGLLD